MRMNLHNSSSGSRRHFRLNTRLKFLQLLSLCWLFISFHDDGAGMMTSYCTLAFTMNNRLSSKYNHFLRNSIPPRIKESSTKGQVGDNINSDGYEDGGSSDVVAIDIIKKYATTLALVATFSSSICMFPLPASAADNGFTLMNDGQQRQGLSVVTQSDLGTSIRRQIVGGAQVVDRLDLQWERFSDSLRDEAKCDPRTNRRMFDNGFRRDGTRIGNPVLGALCSPEPLTTFDDSLAKMVLESGNEAAESTWKADRSGILKKQDEVRELVSPSFTRAAGTTKPNTGIPSSSNTDNNEEEDIQYLKRQSFNQDVYVEMRAIGEAFITNTNGRDAARQFETAWGDKLLTKLGATNANRYDYKSIFPQPEDKEYQTYDEGALLDSLGKVYVALDKLKSGGIIGHYEISIPEDDNWNVVTIAVDDDITIGGQILSRERYQPLSGSLVVAIVRGAMDGTKIPYKMDTFFIDPSTTKQELYNPTQLLISLSDLGQ